MNSRATTPDYSQYDRLRASLEAATGQSVVEQSQGSTILKVTQHPTTTDIFNEQEQVVRLMHVACALGFSFTFPQTRQQIPLDFMLSSAKGALMAAHDFNTRNASIVPDLNNLSCNLKMTLDFYDTGREARQGASVLSKYIHKRRFPYETTAVMGATRSGVSLPMAILNSVQQIPQISYASTSSGLSNRLAYPFFGRVIPSNDAGARAAIDFLSQVARSTHVAILYVDVEFGNDYRLELERAAARAGITTRSVSLRFRQGDAGERIRGSISEAVAQLHDTGYHHYVGVVFDVHMEELIAQGASNGLFGDDRLWVFMDGARAPTGPYPEGSPLVEAARGLAFVGIGSVDRRFLHQFRELDDNEEFMQYFASKTPRATDLIKFTANFSFSELSEPNHFVPLAYDAVMALGLAACSSGSDFPTGQDLMDEFLKVSFMGASGPVAIDPLTATRTDNTTSFLVYNTLQEEPDPEGLVRIGGDVALEYVGGQWQNLGDGFNFSDKTLVPPLSLPVLVQQNNFARGPYILFAAIACLLMLVSASFAIWTWVYREARVVKATQPEFLLVICVGVFFMSFALVLVGSENPPHSYAWANFSCMGSLWCFCLGFGMAFSALFAKTLRIVKLMGSSAGRFRRIEVKAQDVALPVVLIIFGNFATLLTWQLIDPLHFVRKTNHEGSVDHFGRPTETKAVCSGEEGISVYFVSVLFCLNASVVIAANVQAYRARNITTAFSESQYIGLAMNVQLQAFILALPVFFVESGSTASNIAKSTLISVAASSILFLVFIPKIAAWYRSRNRQHSPTTVISGLGGINTTLRDNKHAEVQGSSQLEVLEDSSTDLRSSGGVATGQSDVTHSLNTSSSGCVASGQSDVTHSLNTTASVHETTNPEQTSVPVSEAESGQTSSVGPRRIPVSHDSGGGNISTKEESVAEPTADALNPAGRDSTTNGAVVSGGGFVEI